MPSSTSCRPPHPNSADPADAPAGTSRPCLLFACVVPSFVFIAPGRRTLCSCHLCSALCTLEHVVCILCTLYYLNSVFSVFSVPCYVYPLFRCSVFSVSFILCPSFCALYSVLISLYLCTLHAQLCDDSLLLIRVSLVLFHLLISVSFATLLQGIILTMAPPSRIPTAAIVPTANSSAKEVRRGRWAHWADSDQTRAITAGD